MRKSISCIILFALFLSIFLSINRKAMAAFPRTLTLQQAVTSAINTSYDIRKVKNDMALKRIELTQAIEAIKDIRKKESTIKFSLLFNIEFPKGHGLPKEMELLMKVPQIQSDIKELERKVTHTTLNTKMSAEIAYFNVIELMETCDSQKNRLSSDKNTLNRLSRDYLTGKASKDDYEEMKKSVAQLEKEYQSNLIRYESAKKKLSDIIGINVTAGYTFSKDFSMLKLERRQLDDIIKFALANDYTVYQRELARKIAETEVTTLRNIYNSRWGSMVRIIENEIAKNGPIDFNTFLDKYNTALSNIEAPYLGYYKIRILFITIKIPKEWFRTEYDGIRYFEDEKYALFIALMDKETAEKEEEQARKILRATIEDEFNTLMELWSAYQESLKEIDKAKLQYQRLKEQNLTGNAQFMDVESAKNDVIACENAALSALISYNKSLSSFDFTTAGAISQLKSGVSLTPRGTYDSGVSWLAEEGDGNKPTWYIDTLIDEYKFVFGISIPDGSGIEATHYELCTEDGQLIGERTSIDKIISHLPLTYEGTTKLLVKLYKDNSLLYTSEIDAAEYMGTLELIPVQPGVEIPPKSGIPSGTLIGTWKLVNNGDNHTSTLYLIPEPKYNIGYYQLETTSGNIIGEPMLSIDKPITHLSIIFSSPEELNIKLFDTEGELLGDALIVDDMDAKVIKMK